MWRFEKSRLFLLRQLNSIHAKAWARFRMNRIELTPNNWRNWIEFYLRQLAKKIYINNELDNQSKHFTFDRTRLHTNEHHIVGRENQLMAETCEKSNWCNVCLCILSSRKYVELPEGLFLLFCFNQSSSPPPLSLSRTLFHSWYMVGRMMKCIFASHPNCLQCDIERANTSKKQQIFIRISRTRPPQPPAIIRLQSRVMRCHWTSSPIKDYPEIAHRKTGRISI